MGGYQASADPFLGGRAGGGGRKGRDLDNSDNVSIRSQEDTRRFVLVEAWIRDWMVE